MENKTFAVDTKYAILAVKRLATEFQFLDKQYSLKPDEREDHRESLIQVRACINKLDEMFKEFNF